MVNKKWGINLFAAIAVLIIGFPIFGGPYTIKDIEAQARGASASEAKETALKAAKRQAFQFMLQKLINKQDMERFENAEESTIEFLIDSMQIVSEQMGQATYKATVVFEFNKQRIEELLRNKLVPFNIPVNKALLVLPVFSDGAKTYLFEKDNLWFEEWKHHHFHQALVTFVVPNGDLNDISLLDAEDALIGATHKIVNIAVRYQVSAVVVPYVSITTEGRKLNARVDFQEFDGKGIKKNNTIRSHNLTEVASESSKAEILKKLLKIAVNNIQEFGKNQFGGNQNHNLVYLKVPTKSPDEYLKYIKLLNESGLAQEIQPVELSRGYSVLRVKTFNTLEDLLNYFKDRGHNFEASQEVANPYAYEAEPKGN
jgi:hypothetical protein